MTTKRIQEIRASAHMMSDLRGREGIAGMLVECVDEIERLQREPKQDVDPEEVRAVISTWNGCAHVPKIKELSAPRKKSLAARLSEPFFKENWKAAIERICKSPFCRGENDRRWKADFDWFVRPGTVAKVCEGKYDARGRSTPAEVRL